MDGAQADGPLGPSPLGPGSLGPGAWFREGDGPRYLQLARAVEDGRFAPGARLPPERELALLADVSRVTARKAVGRLRDQGLLEARRGAGSFVRLPAPKVEPSPSRLTSFTETMRARGREPSSTVLAAGLILPPDVLPDPGVVGTSLCEVPRAADVAPARAIRRVAAQTVEGEAARLLRLPDGAALRVERTGYGPSGRPAELTRGLCRSDACDPVAEPGPEAPGDLRSQAPP